MNDKNDEELSAHFGYHHLSNLNLRGYNEVVLASVITAITGNLTNFIFNSNVMN